MRRKWCLCDDCYKKYTVGPLLTNVYMRNFQVTKRLSGKIFPRYEKKFQDAKGKNPLRLLLSLAHEEEEEELYVSIQRKQEIIEKHEKGSVWLISPKNMAVRHRWRSYHKCQECC